MRAPRAALALLLLAPIWPARAAAQPDPQEAVFEIAVGQLAHRTVLALERDGELLLPAAEVFDLIELRVAIDSAGRLTGVRHPEGVPIFVDPVGLTAARGDESWFIQPSGAVQREDGLYLGTAVLERLLEIRIHVDWLELRARVVDPDRLPIARRIARERARQSRWAAPGPAPDRELGLRRPGWDGAVFDWALFYPGQGSLDRTSYRMGLGLNVLGGSLEVGHGNGAGTSERTTASWLGVWPDQAPLRQLGLGDLFGTGPRPADLRGAFVTNAPFIRPARYDLDLLEGHVPPGWEIELYRDGRLLDYTDAGPEGRFRLAAPLDYGPNPLELRAYGPSGQIRIWERAVRIRPERLPPRVFEYGAAAGACRFRPCDAAANLDLHYGLSRGWTVRGGLDAFWRDSLPDLFQPYLSVSGSVAGRWLVRGEALREGFVGADLAYEPTPDLRFGAGGAWFDTGVESPLLTPAGRRRELRGAAFWRPIHRLRSFFFDVSALHVENVGSSLLLTRLGASLRAASIRWTGGARWERSGSTNAATGRAIFDLAASTSLRTPALPALDGLFLRAALDLSDHGFERVEWLASRAVVGDTRLEARVTWLRASDEPFIALGLTTRWPAARAVSQISRTPGGDLTAASLLEGSVLWNGPAHRVGYAPGRSLRRGGLGGLVFLDLNGNGRYDSEDRPLSGVRLRVGPQSVQTDAHGRYAVWDLAPFVVEQVAVDSMSLDSPLWVPAFSLASVTVGPNGFRRLDVPVLTAAEVVGRVVRAGPAGTRPIGGLTLHLVEIDSGRRHRVTTFRDGEFYALGLRPGAYRVEIDPALLESLGAGGLRGDVRFEIEPDPAAEAATAPFLEIELVPDPD